MAYIDIEMRSRPMARAFAFALLTLACSTLGPPTGSAFAVDLVVETVAAPSFTDVTTAVALDSRGNPHALYSDYWLRYATRGPEGWVVESVLENTSCHVASILVDSRGDVHALFVEVGAGRPYYAFRHAGTWTLEQFDRRVNFAIPLAMALDAQGRVHALYSILTSLDLGNTLKYALRDRQGNWTFEILPVPDAPVIISDGDLELDARGRPRVAYTSLTLPPTPGVRHVGFYQFDSANEGWRHEEVPFAGSPIRIDLALRHNGTPAILGSVDPAGFAIVERNGATWSLDPIPAEHSGAVHGFGFDGQGKAAFTVRGSSDESGRAGAYLYTQSAGEWSSQELTGNSSTNPTLAVLPSGRLAALFGQREDEGVTIRLASNTQHAGETLGGPAPRFDVVTVPPQAVRLTHSESGVRLDLDEPRTALVEWFDVRGRRVGHAAARAWDAGSSALDLPATRLGRGLYFVRVRTTLGETASARVFLGGSR